MNPSRVNELTRREFLTRSVNLSIAGSAMPFALNLAAMGEAAAFSATDYKALVCVFLFGGNDDASTLIPYDPLSHGKYVAIRGAPTTHAAAGQRPGVCVASQHVPARVALQFR